MQERRLLKSRLSLRGPEETPSSTLHWKQYLQMPNEIKFVARKIISERCCMMGAGRMQGEWYSRKTGRDGNHTLQQAGTTEAAENWRQKSRERTTQRQKHTSTIPSNSWKDTTLTLFLISKMVSYNLTWWSKSLINSKGQRDVCLT